MSSHKKLNKNYRFIKNNSNRIVVFCGPSGVGKTLVIDYLSKRYRFKKISSITTKDLNKKEKKDGSIQVTPLKFKILETESDLFMSVRNYGNAYAYSTKNIVELLKNKNDPTYAINQVEKILLEKGLIGINNIYEKRASIELTALKYAAANCQAEK